MEGANPQYPMQGIASLRLFLLSVIYNYATFLFRFPLFLFFLMHLSNYVWRLQNTFVILVG